MHFCRAYARRQCNKTARLTAAHADIRAEAQVQKKALCRLVRSRSGFLFGIMLEQYRYEAVSNDRDGNDRPYTAQNENSSDAVDGEM